ncbi:cysteine methyltransferase [Halobacteriales archaeon SW_7_68_16]|nr:MAG: cysteine methyltransferase [Halobacteriales archaeon SW_7_68_16]
MTEEAGVYARESAYLERYVQFGEAQGRVISVSFPDQPESDAGTDHELLDRITAYFEGEETDFRDVTVALTVPTDQRAVLEALRQVPYGEGVSCDRLARMTAGLDPEDDEDRRLVRTTLADNPAPLLIPDHRVDDGPSAAPPPVGQYLRSLEGI